MLRLCASRITETCRKNANDARMDETPAHKEACKLLNFKANATQAENPTQIPITENIIRNFKRCLMKNSRKLIVYSVSNRKHCQLLFSLTQSRPRETWVENAKYFSFFLKKTKAEKPRGTN